MAQLEMMDDSKEIPIIHNDDDNHEEVVEEELIYDNEIMADDMTMGYAEEEEVHCEDEDDIYGGMDHHLYDAIVEFKRSAHYPDLADQRTDRSAHCHWRLRCSRFDMHADDMTLMYKGNEDRVEHPKFVIKKGEVRGMIERVHTLIGHVGTKRTQAALQKRMYWRSVRNDVMTYVQNCGFCRDKKQQGKKLAKAPIDIQSDSFNLNITVEYTTIPGQRIIRVGLHGYDEEFVQKAMLARMTTYTFRSTDSDYRKSYRAPAFFKRQPYLRRPPRFEPRVQSLAYLNPMMNRAPREPSYLMSGRRVEDMERIQAAKRAKFIDDIEEEDEELTPVDPSVASTSRAAPAAAQAAVEDDADDAAAAAAADAPSTSRPRPITAPRKPALRPAIVYDTNHPVYRRAKAERAIKQDRHQRRSEYGAMRGAATRLSGMMNIRGEPSSSTSALLSSVDNTLQYGLREGVISQHDILTPFEDPRERSTLGPLPLVMFIPSHDPEVVELQKVLLNQQIEIQKMQMRELRRMQHIETRYEEVEVDGREMVDEDGREMVDVDGREDELDVGRYG
ncbi:hypothetical protein PMAYCL1PPCAC_11395 [Pristionchus mayeri]|uniref:Integrase zinc-binding domain-containing protein n=1 Tax=Pristionchus mayeri TaxID=1317129 RepID=A0AAN4ZP43_9BILA|nr:hypothetical protein PMAYCL1PPCAC_11395 [Pristionchus mayeri]